MADKLAFTTADLVTCLICIREFDTKTRKPKVLHCGHTVCEECTDNLRDFNALVFEIRAFPLKCAKNEEKSMILAIFNFF